MPITEQTIGGNFVALKVDASGAVAYYAHLKPQSVRVQIGQRVRSGEVLGLLGNSGNSTCPHLHFHLARVPSDAGLPEAAFRPLRASSMPYRVRTLGVFDGEACVPREGVLPAENDVVDPEGCAPRLKGQGR